MKIILLSAYINAYSKNKISIIKYWLINKRVRKVLNDHNIEVRSFVKEYASSVVDYYIAVVKNEHKSKEYPIINELLLFLKEKNISTAEFFTLCIAFRNALIDYTYDLKIANLQIEKEINYIFEEYFYGILDKYTDSIMQVKEKLSKSSDILDKYVIYSRTDLDRNIIKVSKAFCEISNFSKDEIIGQSHDFIIHEDMDDSILEELWNTVKAGEVWHGEIQNKNKEGKPYWLDINVSPVFDENNNTIFYDYIGQNITSKKMLIEQQNILIEQSKAAAMGEMISMIAHQWRQPLQAVSILIQKLPITKAMDGSIPDELLDQVVSGIGTQLEYMSKTIDDFRDFFLPDKSKERVFVSELVHKALDFVSFMLRNDSIDVNIDIKEDIEIEIHSNELVQVLINLIKNSKDAMEDKEIKTRIINISTYKDDNFAIIEIEDFAGGIPKDIITKIFEPYFSTKSDKNGTGLGLYMCKTIVEKHSNGLLSVTNSENGAKFKIKLPIS